MYQKFLTIIICYFIFINHTFSNGFIDKNIQHINNNQLTLIVLPVYFNHQQINLPPAIESNIYFIIESKLSNVYINTFQQGYHTNLHLISQQLTDNHYNELFDLLKISKPFVKINHQILKTLKTINESQVTGNAYLLLGKLEKFNYVQYNHKINNFSKTSLINSMNIQIKYYIILASTQQIVTSFVVNGNAGVAVINNKLAIDYNIDNIINELFFSLTIDTKNNLLWLYDHYYDRITKTLL